LGVIVGPVLAMFVSHVFSASLARQAEPAAHLDAEAWLVKRHGG
jgi:hypothetical protein